MQARIVAGKEACLTLYRLRLGFASVAGQHSCADGTAVGFYALQFYLDPFGVPAKVVAQERRRLIEINDEHIEIAVIVEIPKRAPSAAVCCCNSRARFLDEFLEHSVAEISKDGARCLVG